MSSIPASIPARSKRQAMDWSLVLASQGIDAMIDRDPGGNTWELRVNGPDYARALDTLRQYLRENSGRRWHRELPLTGLIVDWRSLVPMQFLVLGYALQISGLGRFYEVGVMSNQAVRAGEWWRLFTATMLHADPAHLAANVVTGLILFGLAMGAYGAAAGILIPLLAGGVGNLAGLFVYGPTDQRLGASGMVLGALGLLAAQSLTLHLRGVAPRFLAARGILSGCLLLVLLGFSPQGNVDLVGHVAGFVAGLAGGAALACTPAPGSDRGRWFNPIALSLAALLVAVPWWFAFRHGHV